MCASRSANWRCCATADARRAAPPAVTSTIPAVSTILLFPRQLGDPATILIEWLSVGNTPWGEPVNGDRVIRFATAAVACAVTAFAAVVSYSHIYGLGRAHGRDGTAAPAAWSGTQGPRRHRAGVRPSVVERFRC